MKVNENSVYYWIRFAFDNNPKGALNALERAGVQVLGLNYDQAKEVVWQMYLSNQDISWLFENVQYNPEVSNYTGRIGQPGYSSTASKLSFQSIADFIGQVAPSVLGAIFGPQAPAPAPVVVDHTDEILGMQKSVFYSMLVCLYT